MSDKKAVLDCTYGWGKVCRLYRDSLEVAGKSYKLADLTAIHPSYRQWFGIPSARLELCFGKRNLVLRGIPDLEAVRLMVTHLLPYCSQESAAERGRTRAHQARSQARAQARAWERTSKLPALGYQQDETIDPNVLFADDGDSERILDNPDAPLEDDIENIFDDAEPAGSDNGQPTSLLEAETRPVPASADVLRAGTDVDKVDEASLQPTSPQNSVFTALPDIELSALPPAEPASWEVADQWSEETMFAPPEVGEAEQDEEPEPPSTVESLEPEIIGDIAEQFTNHIPRPPSLMQWQPMHTPRVQPPLRSVQLVPPTQRNLEEALSIPIPAIKSTVLPTIHVPVRLEPGECAHYSIGAILCSDRISGSERAPYPPLDHGLLILTNRRIFYTGKRCRLILPYPNLWYVSQVYNAIALHLEGQFRRIIIEIEHPQEWAARIEQLAFIASRASTGPKRPLLVSVSLPGLKPSALLPTTMKRPKLPLSASSSSGHAQQEESGPLAMNATPSSPHDLSVDSVPSVEGPAVRQLPTEEFELAEAMRVCDQITQEFVSLTPSPFYAQATQDFSLVDQVAHADSPAIESFSEKNILIEQQPSSDLYATEALAELPTQEFLLEELRSPTDIHATEVLAELPTQEFPLQEIASSKDIHATEALIELPTQEFVLEQASLASFPVMVHPEDGLSTSACPSASQHEPFHDYFATEALPEEVEQRWEQSVEESIAQSIGSDIDLQDQQEDVVEIATVSLEELRAQPEQQRRDDSAEDETVCLHKRQAGIPKRITGDVRPGSQLLDSRFKPRRMSQYRMHKRSLFAEDR